MAVAVRAGGRLGWELGRHCAHSSSTQQQLMCMPCLTCCVAVTLYDMLCLLVSLCVNACLLCSSCSSGKHGGASSSSSSSSSKGKAKASAAAAEVVHGARVNRAKLARFLDHADDTNDIFRVAAQVIANTIITADQILQQAAADASESSEASAAFSQALSAAAAGQRVVLAAAGPAAATATSAQLAAAVPDAGDEQQVAAAAFEAASSAAAAGADGSTSSSTQKVLAPATAADAASSGVQKQPPSSSPPQPSKEQCLAALKAAFLPYAVGHKAPWWQVAQAAEEAAAAAKAAHSNNKGDDGGDGSSSSDSSSEEDVDPEELAAQLRELAGESLALLRAGLQDERFPELFDLQVWHEGVWVVMWVWVYVEHQALHHTGLETKKVCVGGLGEGRTTAGGAGQRGAELSRRGS